MCAVHILFSSFFIAFYRILLYDAPKLYKYIQKGDDLLASDDAIQLLALLILVILSAFFSSAETSLTTANAIRLQTLADEGNRRAAVALKVKQNPSKMLSAILIGNNLVNNFAASLTTALAIKLFGQGALGIVTAVLAHKNHDAGDLCHQCSLSLLPEAAACQHRQFDESDDRNGAAHDRGCQPQGRSH